MSELKFKTFKNDSGQIYRFSAVNRSPIVNISGKILFPKMFAYAYFYLPCMSGDNQIRLKMSQNEKEVLDHLECLNSSSKMQNSKSWRVIS